MCGGGEGGWSRYAQTWIGHEEPIEGEVREKKKAKKKRGVEAI